jgi:hypothetical protein
MGTTQRGVAAVAALLLVAGCSTSAGRAEPTSSQRSIAARSGPARELVARVAWWGAGPSPDTPARNTVSTAETSVRGRARSPVERRRRRRPLEDAQPNRVHHRDLLLEPVSAGPRRGRAGERFGSTESARRDRPRFGEQSLVRERPGGRPAVFGHYGRILRDRHPAGGLRARSDRCGAADQPVGQRPHPTARSRSSSGRATPTRPHNCC